MNRISQGNKDSGGKSNIIAFDSARCRQTDRQADSGPDSKALQEIIDILKQPFQTSCDTCNGLGFIRSGEDCITCKGTGKVLDDLFRKK